MNKRYTEKTAALICRKLMNHSSGPEFTHYPWTDAEGRQCFCDGYRVYRLQKALSDMPVMPENMTPADPSRFFKALEDGAVAEIPAPDAEAVRAFIKNPSRGKLPFDLGEDMPAADPDYLLDLLRLFPGAAWYVQERTAARESGPIYVVHAAGSALLMPCRKGKDAAARAMVREATEKAKSEAAAHANTAKEEPTAVTIFTPERFAEIVELSAMTPEQFAAAHAA